MAEFVKLQLSGLEELRTVDERLVSYNVEMTEVTGGTFWKAYTPGQIAGTEIFPPISSAAEMANLMQWYDPIDTTNPRLIALAKELGPVWVRVSGTWATKTYYDFDGKGMPEGYQSAMTRQQWVNLINFVEAVGGKLLISVANCDGLHSAQEPWNPSEAEKIFSLSRELGHPIDAVEFTNEPNILQTTGFPVGYTAADFRRDQDLFHKWVRENYPDTLVVGPCTIDAMNGAGEAEKSTAGVGAAFGVTLNTDELMEGCTEKLDVFSYHYYNGISERLASMMPAMHWQPEEATGEAYLAMAGACARYAAVSRDKYVPGGQMWVTESGDAGGGGDTWASTYLDVLRTLNELGEFASITDGVIFHNTLASSDYGFLKHGTFEPRPNYFAALLWTRLMGRTVYASGESIREGAHVFAHSRKDGKEGMAYLVINNSTTDVTTVELPREAEAYVLTGRDGLRSRVMCLNGRDLVLGENDALPELTPVAVSGKVELPAASCAFFVL
ncbi:MAG: beta-glucuronidase [Oscillospiraceae bacterium]|nr:beta-glucuronidase [Oscillospiraceae bacterium]MBQ7129618.1 beta-glucuronidase [Oscillospiraceae bacterium]